MIIILTNHFHPKPPRNWCNWPAPNPHRGRLVWLAQALNPVISGQISGDVGLQWQAPAPDKARSGATGVTVTSTALQLDKFALQQDKTTLARLGQLKIAGLSVPLDGRTATVERVALEVERRCVDAWAAWVNRGERGRAANLRHDAADVRKAYPSVRKRAAFARVALGPRA